MLPQNNSPLPRGSIGFALGIAGMLVSLYFSIMFIAGNATGTELAAGIVFALCLDYGKVALASEAMLAMVQFRLFAAVCYTIIVLMLYALSILAASFILTGHNTNAIVAQSDSRIATVEKQIAEKRAELSACNPNILTKCINPRTAELTALQSELTNAQALDKDVIEAKNRAETWDKLAKVLGSTSDDLQVKLAFARAVLLEIIAPLYVSIFLASYRSRFPSAAPAAHAPVQHIEVAAPMPERIESAPMQAVEKKS